MNSRKTNDGRAIGMQNEPNNVERIEGLVQQIEAGGSAAQTAQVRELLQALLDLHGAALSSILEKAYHELGQAFIDEIADDEVVGSVLLLHDLHPLSRAARVVDALESVKPYLASHGGSVELVDVTGDGTVVLRLHGSCDGCPSSQATLKHTIEEAIYAAAPDIQSIEMDQQSGEVGEEFIPMATMQWDDCPFPANGATITT